MVGNRFWNMDVHSWNSRSSVGKLFITETRRVGGEVRVVLREVRVVLREVRVVLVRLESSLERLESS